ncbi:synaptojanin-1-like [Fukomys damarensis]|uniref:synaptojanin-1-like n=1 Tax=Fukomys damarensis TaxID=885580 RepID=UPI00145512DC|nr:synaptojanin-1-like [Fukomys damarensis]
MPEGSGELDLRQEASEGTLRQQRSADAHTGALKRSACQPWDLPLLREPETFTAIASTALAQRVWHCVPSPQGLQTRQTDATEQSCDQCVAVDHGSGAAVGTRSRSSRPILQGRAGSYETNLPPVPLLGPSARGTRPQDEQTQVADPGRPPAPEPASPAELDETRGHLLDQLGDVLAKGIPRGARSTGGSVASGCCPYQPGTGALRGEDSATSETNPQLQAGRPGPTRRGAKWQLWPPSRKHSVGLAQTPPRRARVSAWKTRDATAASQHGDPSQAVPPPTRSPTASPPDGRAHQDERPIKPSPLLLHTSRSPHRDLSASFQPAPLVNSTPRVPWVAWPQASPIGTATRAVVKLQL